MNEPLAASKNLNVEPSPARCGSRGPHHSVAGDGSRGLVSVDVRNGVVQGDDDERRQGTGEDKLDYTTARARTTCQLGLQSGCAIRVLTDANLLEGLRTGHSDTALAQIVVSRTAIYSAEYDWQIAVGR